MKTAKHMTPAEVLADYNENKRREDERTAAAKVLTSPAEVLGNIYGNKTRAEVLAALLNCTTDHAADLLAAISNTRNRQDVPGMGSAKLIEQVADPEMVFQLIEAKDTEEFDRFLGILLGMHESPIYIQGRTDFIVMFQGCKKDLGATQENYKQKVQHIHDVRDQAARWWHLYGKN